MNNKFVGIVVVFVALAGALLFRATQQTASNVYMPSQLNGAHADLKRIRVAGKVADMPIDYQLQPSLMLSFSIVDPSKNPHADAKIAVRDVSPIKVVYYSTKPDMFAVGRDVIIDGSYEGGIVQASRLLTQCPSKYEAPQPGAQYNAPTAKPDK